MSLRRYWLVFAAITAALSASGQQVRIDLGPDEIALNQAFKITLTIENERLKSYAGFPDIPGFVKRGTSTRASTNIINGRRTFSESIIQNYSAAAEGEYLLKAFEMKVNGKPVKSAGKKIKVGPARQQGGNPFDLFGDPFEDFFGGNNRGRKQEFVDVKADAFLALTTDKESVYLGEGFTTTIAFYVSAKNRAEMSFYDLNAQLPEIIKKIKPGSCWEERFEIGNISGEPVEINGQRYDQFKIYQATFYPLNTETIEFPSFHLNMMKYKLAKHPSFFGRSRQQIIEKFTAKEKQVSIKELPPHPLRESVAVGSYRLKEKLSQHQLKTGESFNYAFNITGEGNISAITDPAFQSDENFDFYPPNVKQDIRKSNGRVRGMKSFSFYGIPNEPGEYDMSKYFSWIFFNPAKESYDTLRSELTLHVSGESKKNESISSTDMGSFYDTIDFKDNELISLQSDSSTRWIANTLIVLMLGFIGFVLLKK